MNSVILIGNLTRDPELRYSTGANQTAICRFSIAVNDGYGDNERTSFINIVVFGKQAENCDRYLAKGRKVAVNGRLQTGSYEKNGQKIYTTDVVADRVEFLGRPQEEAAAQDQSKPAPAPMPTQNSAWEAIKDDDIPF